VSEIEKARRMTLGDQFGCLTTMRGQASDLGSNWMTARNLDFTREYVGAISRVTTEQVQRVAQSYLVDQALSVTSLNPPESLAATTGPSVIRRRAEIQKFVLENGLTLLVKEDRRVPLVAFQATLRGGLLSESGSNNGVSQLMSRTLVKGTGRRDAAGISQVLEEAGGSIGASSAGSSFALAAEVLRPDLDLGLDVFSDVLLGATFPAEEVELERDAQIAAIKGEEDQLVTVAFKELRKQLFGTHPFAMMANGSEESVAELDRDEVVNFYREHVVSGNAVVAVFGDVDVDEIRGKTEAALAGMASGGRRESPEVGGGLTESISTDVDSEKRQAVLAVAYPSCDLMSEDRLPLDLIDEACSDMASRLFIRIREELGLAYYVGSTQILGMAPGAFGFYLGTSPEQLEKAQGELLGEIDHLGREGLDEDELERAKKTWIGKQIIQNQSSGALARMASIDELYGLGYRHHEEVVDQVRGITRAQILDVAQRYFAERPRVVVRVIGK
jgi:zinc protease